MKEVMVYELELKIDDNIYSFRGPAYAPIHSMYDAASQFFLVMKNKLDKVNEKLEADAKEAASSDPLAVEETEVKD